MKSQGVCECKKGVGFTPLEITSLTRMSKKERKKREKRISLTGFTLVELMIVIAILALLIAGAVPLAVNFYNLRNLDVQEQHIVQALRRAQLKAMSGEADSAFGVYIVPGQYVLFKGDSYATRDPAYDEVFNLPANLSVSGLSEVVFSKLNGTTTNTGNITLTIGNRTKVININEMGRINY